MTKTKQEKRQVVRGIGSQRQAERLATILLVLPRGVLVFQDGNPNTIELRTQHRVATLSLTPQGVTLTTRVIIQHTERVRAGLPDKEIARALLRFFNCE